MKSWLFLMFLGFASCATWGDTARDAANAAHHGGVVLRERTFPVVNKICSRAVRRCKRAGIDDPSNCAEWQKCDAARRDIGESLKTIQSGVKVTLIALERLEALGISPEGEE